MLKKIGESLLAGVALLAVGVVLHLGLDLGDTLLSNIEESVVILNGERDMNGNVGVLVCNAGLNTIQVPVKSYFVRKGLLHVRTTTPVGPQLLVVPSNCILGLVPDGLAVDAKTEEKETEATGTEETETSVNEETTSNGETI